LNSPVASTHQPEVLASKQKYENHRVDDEMRMESWPSSSNVLAWGEGQKKDQNQTEIDRYPAYGDKARLTFL
jgi:hypothetical protein